MLHEAYIPGGCVGWCEQENRQVSEYVNHKLRKMSKEENVKLRGYKGKSLLLMRFQERTLKGRGS